MQGVKGLTPTGGTCPNNFSDPLDLDIPIQCALSWKIVVSEWWSVIAVSLNVSGGVRLIKLPKLYMRMQTHYKHDEDRRIARGVPSHGSVPLSHSENVITKIGLHTFTTLLALMTPPFIKCSSPGAFNRIIMVTFPEFYLRLVCLPANTQRDTILNL